MLFLFFLSAKKPDVLSPTMEQIAHVTPANIQGAADVTAARRAAVSGV